ncbi:hypothetical protein N7454_001583 [Penicillium verhagenii]|nr:hypothetical protein N7454_001583 [Penicillium verhagenii]
MDRPNSIVYPYGAVIIRMIDANAPFAPTIEDDFSGMILLKSAGRVQSPAKNKIPKDSDTESHENEDGQVILESSDAKPPAADNPTDQPSARTYLTFQASTEHLTSASPVFQRMLTGPWKESSALSQRGSLEVIAKEWDSHAFLIVLRLMHGQHHEVPRKLDLEMLAKVAVVADYYDCKQALNLVTGMWISKLEKVPETYCRDLILWVWISWFFQLPFEFQKATSATISMSEDTIDGLDLPIPGVLIISNDILGMMNRDRLKLIGNMITLIDDTGKNLLRDGKGHSFKCRSMISRAISKQMASNNLRLTYRSLKLMVSTLRSPQTHARLNRYETGTGCIPASTNSHRCPNEAFYSFFPGVNFSVGGYPLDSIQWT